MDFDIILKYFPNLPEDQIEKLKELGPLYQEWNNQINVISRKDMDHFFLRHVLHSLTIAKHFDFAPKSEILDIGTGGGFPGIPLAILFPEVNFTLVDSIGKKIKVVNEVKRVLKIENVNAFHQRAEQNKGKYDYIISRAVTRMNKFLPWTIGKFKNRMLNHYPNGIIYLKGGDLKEEMNEIKKEYDIFDLSRSFEEEFFETKKIVYVRMI